MQDHLGKHLFSRAEFAALHPLSSPSAMFITDHQGKVQPFRSGDSRIESRIARQFQISRRMPAALGLGFGITSVTFSFTIMSNSSPPFTFIASQASFGMAI
jgi:hypothetical protein